MTRYSAYIRKWDLTLIHMQKLVLCLLFSFLALDMMAQKDETTRWNEVDTLISQGLLQSALDKVTAIYEESKREHSDGQAVKALLMKVNLESSFQEEGPLKSIRFVRSEMEAAGSPVRQILSSVLAQLYTGYYHQNRWLIDQRTPVLGDLPEDMASWDGPMFMETAARHYLLSLSEAGVLQNTGVEEFGEILEGDEETRRLRPTLYDLLVFRAIGFFSANNPSPRQGAGDFRVDQEFYFAPAGQFARQSIPAQEALSFDYIALEIFRELLLFREKGPVAAYIDADLQRLEFVHLKSTLQEKGQLYIGALRQLAGQHENIPEFAEIVYPLARQIQQQGYQYKPLISDLHKWEVREALELAEKAAARFPGTTGARNCLAVVSQIKSPLLQINGLSEVIPGQPSLASVEYRNVETLFFRIVTLEPGKNGQHLQMSGNDKLKSMLAKTPLTQWSQGLPGDGDFQTHRTEIRIPALRPGFYMLLASTSENFAEESEIRWYPLWSTSLTLVTRQQNGTPDRSGELLVLDRLTGEPVPGVTIQPWFMKYDQKARKQVAQPGQRTVTDKEGAAQVSFPADTRVSSCYYELTARGETTLSLSFYRGYHTISSPEEETRVWFFTDRSIYRPGQTIFYKGIAIRMKGDLREIRSEFPVTVKFTDANGQLVTSREMTSNDFGSFEGSFVAPKGVLTGQMTISCDHGSTSIRVEEYKRPRFEVTFLPASGTCQLGETVTMQGQVLNYAGNGVDGAQVKFRVVRHARFPFPRWLDPGFPQTQSAEIASGVTHTSPSGEFTIVFTALPDPELSPSSSALFTYTLYADVTDITGETHSGETSVVAAFAPFVVSTSLGELVNAISGREASLMVTNPGGETLEARGTIIIRSLKNPGGVLFERRWARPDRFTMTREEFTRSFPGENYDNDDDATTWPQGKVVFRASFETPRDSLFSVPAGLNPGNYLLEITARDLSGKEVVHSQVFNLFRPEEGKSAMNDPLVAMPLRTTAEPGETVDFLVSSPLARATLLLVAESKGGEIMRRTLRPNGRQIIVAIPVTEADRGDIVISTVMVSHNRLFKNSKRIVVPYTHKKLDLVAGSFRSALEPGSEEEWQITIRDSKGNPAVAELLAGMYDASLDAFTSHAWPFSLYGSFSNPVTWKGSGFNPVWSQRNYFPRPDEAPVHRQYEQLRWWNNAMGGMNERLLKRGVLSGGNIRIRGVQTLSAVAESAESEESAVFFSVDDALPVSDAASGAGSGEPPAMPPAKPRSDFSETAFFFPRLMTGKQGEIVLRFKMPESLTRWRMMALAHTKDLQTGTLEYSLVTRRELMIFPHPPRFLREGDRMAFSAKISNLSGRSLSGTAEIHFFDALTMDPVDHLMGLRSTVVPFSVEQNGTVPVEWPMVVPEGLQAVVYRITATSGSFSDGEEAPLAVLPDRLLVTETLPMPVRGKSNATFSFDQLAESGKPGSSRRNYRMTVEFSSNPAWYAVQALPYLTSYPHECSEQLFSRFYAHSLAQHIAASDPEIRRVFDAWKLQEGDALTSPLAKNEELRSVQLQETPWVREASSDSERRQNLALLFDATRMAAEQKEALTKLQQQQAPGGGWPWFPGMRESEYITRHIVAGLGRMSSRGVISRELKPATQEIITKAVKFLDGEMAEKFSKMKKEEKDYLTTNHFDHEVIHYFFARSYFTGEHPFPAAMEEMVAYYRSQAARFWTGTNNYMKGMTALFLHRMGDKKLPVMILRSLKETALHNDEMGMYWRNEPRGWRWHEAPIESQALLVEAFDEVTGDSRTVEELKVWLLKQKQTQDWRSTRATAEAVWALLMRGGNLLAGGEPVSITAGGHQMNPSLSGGAPTEAGTGYFKVTRQADEISPAMARLEVRNPNPGAAWGGAYYQYFEEAGKVTPAQSPLEVSREFFREVNTPQGPVLEPVGAENTLKTGDKVVVRIIVKSDRDMEYIHLKEMRASALEPVNVLSGYHWQGGLGYYESTLDASSNFFISHLPKGSHVFEIRMHATRKGEFSNGITTVQCMYAPEFSAHSGGSRIIVEE